MRNVRLRLNIFPKDSWLAGVRICKANSRTQALSFYVIIAPVHTPKRGRITEVQVWVAGLRGIVLFQCTMFLFVSVFVCVFTRFAALSGSSFSWGQVEVRRTHSLMLSNCILQCRLALCT